MKNLLKILAISLFSTALLAGSALADGDLDDGISKFTDDGIGKYDELGKSDPNIKFIVLNAKSKAAMKKGDSDKAGNKTGDANMNSVVLGAGSNIKGDIYIIDQSKGPKTNIAD
jgi:hypothetical protein